MPLSRKRYAVQLLMEKTDLDNVPVVDAHSGYLLRTYRDGDETGLARVYAACDLGKTTPKAVREGIIHEPCFTPYRLFVAECAGDIVGTAAAWIEDDDPSAGYLHMVGLLPEHRGKGLGKALVCAAIRHTRSEGFRVQRLKTDDFRTAAICLYLSMGYYPLMSDPSHPARWEAIARGLNRPEISKKARPLPPQPA